MAADSRTANRIVEALLDRLYATLARGPAINCAPHHSRQRIDLTELERLGEATAGSLLAELLGPEGKCRVRPEMAKLPPKPASADDEPPEVRAQRRANEQRQQLLRKLSTIASDADSYRRDTGAHVLYVGYPILSLPEAPAGKLRATSRILAPLAFVPVELRVSTGTRPFVELLCSESGADRVVPNVALKAWLEHQLGRRFPELFDDEEGEDPLREIAELTREVCRLLEMPEAPPLTGWPVTRMPLSADLPDAPTVLTGVVLGMYPLRNQATIQDMEALQASEEFPPTVRPFLTLEATQAAGDDEVYGDDNDKGTSLVAPVDEHLIDRADPCQRRAVLRARDAHGLVIHGPPGTGKSQTITNIIGDCLARQKRVLLVCEKRTALDVVKHRLDARGLGPLCAVVHDATHDRTPLYMGLREQLEGLAGAPEPADPSRQLKRVNDEIARLEADLRAYYDALAANDERLGEAFHDIAGRWLLAGGETFPPRADTLPPGVTDLDPEDMLAREGDVRGLVRRLLAARAGDNAWEGRHATTLEDYMTQSPPAIREALRNAAEAAGKSRALAVRELPPFPESVAGEGAFRRDLAARVRQLEAAVPLTLRRAVLVRGAAGWDALRQALAQVAAWRTVLERGPLDADLFATFALSPWEAGRVVTAVAHLTEYLARGQGFAGFFRFGVRSRAREALAPLGLVANAVNAARGKTFLEGVHARNLLRGFWKQHLAADVPVPADDVGLRAGLDALTALLDGVAHVERHPGGAPMVSAMTAALLAPEGAGEFAARLDRSADHAAALEVAVGALERVPLLTAPARAALRDKLLHGGEADADLERLREDIDVLEPLLRFEAEARTFPAAVGTALRTFVAADDDEDGAWKKLFAGTLLGALERLVRAHPELHRLDPTRIEEHFARLHELSFEKMALETHAILHLWAGRQRSRLLAATGTRLNGAGAELRRRLMLRGKRASRIREVIHGGRDVEGGDPLFDLHPVWMTSPETAAQIFPLEPLFDLVIFDEASQCRLEEGVPVLCRGKGVVVAGDTKQLPPTRFFESAVVGSRQEDADEVGSEEGLFQSQQSEVEDLLGAALNIEIEQSYLDVHYRSTSEELIAFSNEAFYGARLQAIPGHPNNRPNEPSIRLHHAGGIYEERRNPIEAAAIVELVRDYLRRENPPSIGIATFNLDQRDLIEEELDRVAEEDPAFRMVLAAARERVGQGSFEGLFVKNLENVQGDERDVMMIGTTYGPNAEGRFYRRFGPLGRAGGERRLNVLVTRARLRVHVVTSIPPEVYRAEAQRATPAGMRANGALYLMRYLVQAERVADYYGDTKRAAPEPEDAVAPPPPHVLVHHTGAPSAFVEHLAELLLRNHGIPSMLYYGNDGFCVDLAFRHPARPDEVTVGVVVDATRYRRAEDRVEWDDFRRTVLGAQRWDLHRIWTPHFVRDPEGTVARLVAAARSYEQEPVPE